MTSRPPPDEDRIFTQSGTPKGRDLAAISPRTPPQEAPDPAEVWGKRIGRGLAVLAAPLLIWLFGAQLGWW